MVFVDALPRATATARMLIPQLRLQRQEAHARFSIPRIFQIFPPHCHIVHFSFLFYIIMYCVISYCLFLSFTLYLLWLGQGDGLVSIVHTWYLSRTPRICSCKFFLAGVNFYRFNAKNWQFIVYFAVITQKIGNLLCILT